MNTRTLIGAACGIVLAASGPGLAVEIVDVRITGNVASNNFNRGPWQKAQVGDPVRLDFLIDADNPLVGDNGIVVFQTFAHEMTIVGELMQATVPPAFTFSTFVTFNGFEMTSTSHLFPGGGKEHEYVVPIFGATGPTTIWPPVESGPDEHSGFFPSCLFDFFHPNEVRDRNADGPGLDRILAIDFVGIDFTAEVELCPPDVNNDGTVDFMDILSLLSNWGSCQCACREDIDGDGTVTFADLLELLSAWGPCP